MINSKKKGFTIVELVIVIAVVAILAAVLIPTFSNLVKKTNLSADQQAIANMNKIVTAGNIIDEYEYPSDAVVDLYNNGWNDKKLQTYSKGFHYGYSKEKVAFYLIDDNDQIVYPANADANVKDLWCFYTNTKADKVKGVTKYIALDSMHYQAAFDEVFGDGNNYIIDLANNTISVEGKSTVTVLNGRIVGEGFAIGDDAAQIGKWDGEKSETGIYKDLHFVGEGELFLSTLVSNVTTAEFINCVFDYDSTDLYGVNLDSLTFKDCVFYEHDATESEEFALKIQHCELGEVIIDGCYFKGERGIHINADGLSKITFINNTIALTWSGEKAYGIQITSPSTATIEIKGNTMLSGHTAIRIHKNYGGDGSNISLGNNKVAEGIKKLLIESTTVKNNSELENAFN